MTVPLTTRSERAGPLPSGLSRLAMLMLMRPTAAAARVTSALRSRGSVDRQPSANFVPPSSTSSASRALCSASPGVLQLEGRAAVLVVLAGEELGPGQAQSGCGGRVEAQAGTDLPVLSGTKA